MRGVRWIWFCGRRAVERCIGAKIQGKEQRWKQKEMIVGSGTLFTRRATRWERHDLNNSRCLYVGLAAVVQCADCAAVDCAAGMRGRTPGGRRIKDMRAVASSADQGALWSHGRRLVLPYNICTPVRPSDSFSVGASGKKTLSMRCQRP
jgi:hypothetical protein